MATGHKGLCRINVVMPRDLGRALQGDGQLHKRSSEDVWELGSGVWVQMC